MRKIKSTALLGAFVAVASLGAISHEAHGTTVSSAVSTIAKEYLPNIVSLPAPTVSVPSNVTYGNPATVKLTLSGATFANGYTYAIVGAGSSTECTGTGNGTNIVTLTCTAPTASNPSLTAGDSYTIVGGLSTAQLANSPLLFSVSVPQTTNSIVLYYSSENVPGDQPSSTTLAQVQQQLTVTPAKAATATIDPSSLSTFEGGNNTATNTITISSLPPSEFTFPITSDTLNVIFNGIPNSVSSVYAIPSPGDYSSSIYAQGAGSATVSLTLPSTGPVFDSPPSYSDIATFYFSNSGNIQPGTIYISSILGATGLYQYLPSGSQNFLSFSLPATQIYIPDALVSDSNAIDYSYLTISMPQGATISSISVLNTGVNCSVSSISLTHTGTTGVYYMDLSQLVQACQGISSTAWQAGVPLVITISGSNVGPNTVTADAYAVFAGHMKRIPVNVVAGNNIARFSY